MVFDWLYIAQGAANGAGATPNPLVTFFPFILVIGIFWMLVISPQRKKDKQRREMLEALSKGDDIVTSGGICGSIVGINEKTVVVKVSEEPKLKMEFLRTSIAMVVPKESKDAKDAKE